MVNTTKPDVIIATETWLDGSVSSAELESDAYTSTDVIGKQGDMGV